MPETSRSQKKQLCFFFVCVNDSRARRVTPGTYFVSYQNKRKDRNGDQVCVGGSSVARYRGQEGHIPVCVWGRPVERQGVVITEGGDGELRCSWVLSAFCQSYQVWVGQELTLNISQKTGNQNKSKSTSLSLLRTDVYLKWMLQSAYSQETITAANELFSVSVNRLFSLCREDAISHSPR